jgi:hypothetical protein
MNKVPVRVRGIPPFAKNAKDGHPAKQKAGFPQPKSLLISNLKDKKHKVHQET